MYLCEEMIELALNDTEWLTSDHKTVAVNACISNPLVKNMDDLLYNVRLINTIPAADIRTITGDQLMELGCYV